MSKVMFVIWILICVAVITGCTISVTMIHTSGQASDIVDDTDSITPTIDTNIPVSIPAK